VRERQPLRPTRESPRLARRRTGERSELWTEAVGTPPPVYGERWVEVEDRTYRLFEPSRSKLAAAIVHGWSGDLPRVGERWVYLGAASGTTASHLADLVGPSGRVYAVEKSLRPFARLYSLSERWPNLLPVLADARFPAEYSDLVPPADGIYADVAQPDQLEILRRNAALFLRGPSCPVLLALKTASMGRDRAPAAHLAQSEELLGHRIELEASVKLDPFHRAHYLVGGRAKPSLFVEGARAGLTLRPARSRAPRRP